MRGRISSGGRINSFSEGSENSESINPMESVANLVDVMLVFACGLILALVTIWNVDISPSTSPSASGDGTMYEVDEVIDNPDNNETVDTDLQEVGTVYKDPATGKWYFKDN